MTGAQEPRRLLNLTGYAEWRSAAAAHRITPPSVAVAVAAAFSAAVERVADGTVETAQASGEGGGGHRRRFYEGRARELGIGRVTFTDTANGRRWPTLSELSLALASPVLGSALRVELTHYLPCAKQVLDCDQDVGSTSPGGRLQGQGRGMKTGPASTSIELRRITERVREDVQRADMLVAAAHHRGETIHNTTDWRRVREALNVPRRPASGSPRSGSAEHVRARGIENLAARVRALFADGEHHSSASVKRVLGCEPTETESASGSAWSLDASQVDRVLSRLKQRGELEKVAHGVYVATEKLAGGPGTR